MDTTTLKISEKSLTLTRQTIELLDCLAAVGYFIEVIDAKGYYIYLSENCTYDSVTPKDVIGKHATEVFDMTQYSSVLLTTLNTGTPYRDIHTKYKSAKTGKTFHFLYNSFPVLSGTTITGAITIYRHLDDVKRAINYLDTANTLDLINTKPIVRKEEQQLYTFDDIICQSDSMNNAVKLAKRVSKTDSSVLIVGETGTGKELFAQSLHSFYKNRSQPFIAINCAAIPETLLESILFGSTKGTYTGAMDKQGLFEDAHGGTIFLDELLSLSIAMQAKILRVLETKTVRRVGGDKQIPVNVRVVSAINANPLKAIEEGQLKADLFYRIAVITIRVPPLRERGDGLKLLTNSFVREVNKKLGTHLETCSDRTFHIFEQYNFPGNCRELKHIIEHAANMVDEGETVIEPHHLPYYISDTVMPESDSCADINKPVCLPQTCFEIGDYKKIHQTALDEFNINFNTRYLTFVLKQYDGNISKAARAINISRQHLHGLIAKYDIQL